MGTVSSQITSLTIVYSTVYSDADQRKHQSSASLGNSPGTGEFPAQMPSNAENVHTMDLLWEKFQWILPLYMKPISFQSKASVVCSVTTAIFIDFCLKKLIVFSQHISKKNKWISEFRRTNPQELKCWSTFCVNYFLRFYLMMQHQPIVKRVNGTHEWAHRPYQLLITAACTNTAGKMNGSHSRAADRCPFVPRHG